LGTKSFGNKSCGWDGGVIVFFLSHGTAALLAI
jgi:hypothetical protein